MVTLADAEPVIASDWLYAKNAGWGPEHFSRGSSVRAWWQCPFCLHDYKAPIIDRTKNRSACPYCASRKVCAENALAALYPELIKEWHPKKNLNLKASDVTYAASKLVWWLCSKCKHSWQTPVHARSVRQYGCPACFKQRRQYARAHPSEKNRDCAVLGVNNQNVSRAWYEAGRIKFLPLSKSHPALAKQWHPTANGKWKPADFAYGSTAVAWWKCAKGIDHEWQSHIYSRTKNNGRCPFCLGRRVSITNSLKTVFPLIAREWHPILNKELSSGAVTAHCGKKVWWLCSRDATHAWEAPIASRVVGKYKCPFCTEFCRKIET